MSKTSERSVRLYTQRLVQAEESRKKRESSLLLPELQRCLTFSAWPSKGSVVFDPSLYFTLQFLSPPSLVESRVLINIADPQVSLSKHCKIIVRAWTRDENLRRISPLILKILFIYFFFSLLHLSTPPKSGRSFCYVAKKIPCYLAPSSLIRYLFSSACQGRTWDKREKTFSSRGFEIFVIWGLWFLCNMKIDFLMHVEG